MDMRKSRVLRQLRAGKVATCTKLNLCDPRVAEIAAMTGFDCIWIDMEHVPNDMKCVVEIARACKIYDVDVLTRVSRGSYSDLIRPLEADSAGIMVPHLMSLEDAKKIVYYTKFHPIGRRPIDGGNADGKFCLMPANEYMAAHFCESDFDYQAMCATTGLSYNHFKNLFIKQLGQSPVRRLTSLRMERAREMLITGQYSVTEIAAACGFDNVYYFSTVFKKHFGVAPSRYK